jgi:hypothetical protein
MVMTPGGHHIAGTRPANKVKSIDARARQAREVILSIERKPEIDPVLSGNDISICSAR